MNDRLELLKQTSQLGGQDAALQEEKRNGLAASTQISKVLADMMAEENRLLDLRKQATAAADVGSERLVRC